MLPKAAVICALLALFSAGSQGNKEANVYNHHRAAQEERVLPRVLRFVNQPKVFRRDSGTCLPDSDEYYRRQDLLACDEKYIRAVFNEIETSNCTNEYYNDTTLFYECGTNDNGDVCAGIDDSIYYDFYYQCYRSFYTSNCSSACQTDLRQLSDSVGCCIHDDYDLRMPSVWMNCDVEQPEVCADAPNITGSLAKRNVGLCTEKCSLRQLLYVFCKNLGKEYEKLNRECGVEDVLVSFCGFDKGEFCFEMDYRITDSYIETITDECYSEGSNVRDGVCSTNCRNVLVEFIDTVGCCFNLFNDTFFNVGSTLQVLSPDLFSACDIEVPDACNSFNSRAVPDDFLECAGRTINNKINITNNGNKTNDIINTSGAALQSGVYSIGLTIIGLIVTYIY